MHRLLARKPVGKLRHSYVSTNVTTSAWVSVGTIPAAASAMEIYDSSGRVLKASVDNGSTELNFYILPGAAGFLIPIEWKKSQTLYLKAVDASSTVGQLVINFYG
jgi:hypothetical protein